MKRLATLLLLLLAAGLASGQTMNSAGEILNICRTWDGTDVLAINADGSLNALCSDGAGAFNVIVDSSALPAGASTSALQTTGNTSLATLAGAVAGTEMQVDVLTSALPSGAATSANQTTTIGHVDGLEALLANNFTTTSHDAAFGVAGTADAQVRSVQGIAGGTALPISAASLPLPTGAATAAGQLADGHNVTVDNAAGASAVNIQDGGNTITVDGTVSITANSAINLAQIVGQAPTAHDTAIGSAPPILVGGVAETAEDSEGNSNDNLVSADGDATRLMTDRYGTLFVRSGPAHRWAYHENSSSALTDTTVHASCGTGMFNYVESITASTGGATAFSLLIEDSTTATILGPYHLEAVSGRGFNIVFPGGRKQTNSATLISVTTTGAVAHGIDITGFCAP